MTAFARPAWMTAWVVWMLRGKTDPRPPSVPKRITPEMLWIPAWVAWNLHGRQPAKRPTTVPKSLARYPWAFDLHRDVVKALTLPAPPPTATSHLHGYGWLTAWDPAAALELPGGYVVVRENATPEIVAEYRARGKRVGVWEVRDGAFAPGLGGQALLDELAGDGPPITLWMPQDENAHDREVALETMQGIRAGVEVVFLTNNHAPHAGRRVAVEAYENVNPLETIERMVADARNLGGVVEGVIPGLYDGSSEQAAGSLVPLDAYLRDFDELHDASIGFVPYLAEHAATIPAHAGGLEVIARRVG